jgi:CheY-like chemotaxis protein
MSALLIVVNTDPRVLRHTEALLSEAGYLVASVSSFAGARKLLDSVTPDLLIADISSERFNGLQLALRSQLHHPDVQVILTSASEDAAAEAEAWQSGAVMVTAPLENPSFLPCVRAAVARRHLVQARVRRWSRKPVAGVVEVNAAGARAQIIDVSGGGVRLAFSDPRQVPPLFDIVLPSSGGRVKARSVWSTRSADADMVYCGAELAEAVSDQWRQFVDALQDQDRKASQDQDRKAS